MRPSMPSRKAATSTITHRGLEAVLEGQPDAGQAGADRQHRDQIGQHHAQRDLADARPAAAMRFEGQRTPPTRPGPAACRPPPPNSASTVSPPTAVWPTATRSAAALGRNTSTREPKRIRPKRSPMPILVPASAQQTMRRATSPAICTAATVPFGLSMTSAVALVLAARLVELGVEEFAGAVLDLGDAAAHRRAVHMAGEDVHEHRDARHLGAAEAELARRHGRADRGNDAVGRADHQPVVERRHALGSRKK